MKGKAGHKAFLIQMTETDSSTTPETVTKRQYLRVGKPEGANDAESIADFSNLLSGAGGTKTYEFEKVLDIILDVDDDANLVEGADPLIDNHGALYKRIAD